MAKKKKSVTTNTEAHRVNMTFTLEEYESLCAAAAKIKPIPLAPTVMAKHLVMKALG
jgi:hypothetical protein